MDVFEKSNRVTDIFKTFLKYPGRLNVFNMSGTFKIRFLRMFLKTLKKNVLKTFLKKCFKNTTCLLIKSCVTNSF